ncbi:MAG TPA: SRPBCC family protein [Noviherbaspirillum sp.]|uniref:SRPBCC family protein n=1 Tax=Noviherbaspirillum sp. TaxID=1926288 RepID=UPI002D4A395E|nr:SRPBCC family protein [Noviherbaspirillum sp.]HYD96964.1 SRPBCC family protein [Noviherbaspirillum sp.]
MARIQQSIEIGVPAHIAYNQLTQFEDYPRFMHDIENVHQLDDTHLHWSARMAYQQMEWDSEITEQIPDQCIAWRNAGGPIDAGKVEVQPVGQDKARVTLTMECDPDRLPAQAGNVQDVLARQIGDDLARFKEFIETRGSETGAWRGEVHDAQTGGDGGEGGEGIGKTIGQTAQERRDAAASAQPLQADETMQSAPSMSQSADDDSEDGRYSVAEEQNFDQQSDQARRVGQMPLDFGPEEARAGEAMAKSMKQGKRGKKGGGDLEQSIERAVPPSE